MSLRDTENKIIFLKKQKTSLKREHSIDFEKQCFFLHQLRKSILNKAGGAASVLRSNPEQHCNKSAVISKLLTSTYSRNAPNFVLASHSEALLHSDAPTSCLTLPSLSICTAHRVVLAACSDYFCVMFTDAMREARQSEIKLNGVNARGIELLIEA
uniref:BTB domain-containing protein n=1 Tax=Glossina brevipalpis TaxID=37001 RepID=A0A1A9WCI4_9MUSC